jgi:hypothetical protein
MSIENALQALTVAVEANTAALKGGAPAAATGDKPTTKARGKAGVKPSHSRSELVAVMSELREAQGASVAKAMIKEVGGSDKLADVPDANVDALFEAGKKALGNEDENGSGDGL